MKYGRQIGYAIPDEMLDYISGADNGECGTGCGGSNNKTCGNNCHHQHG